MKTDHNAVVEIASVDINCVNNVIDPTRITIQANNGKFSLKAHTEIRIEWPLAIQFTVEQEDGTSQKPYNIPVTDVCEAPRNVGIQILLSDMDDLDTITKVALARASRLKIYADFPEDKLTFELITLGGHSYGMQSLSLYETRLKPYVEVAESEC